MSLRRTGIAIVALAAGMGMLVLVAHTPFARRAVLGYARSVLQRDYGLVLEASRLDYNLAAFRVGLADVRLLAAGETNEPFFESEYVAVRLSPRALLGDLRINDLSLTNALVRVHRRADGTSNLPNTDSAPGGDPAPIPIDRFDAPRLTIDVLDEQIDARLQIPTMAVLLMRDGGSISLAQPAEIRAGDRMTTIALNAGATFDGRTLRLTGGQAGSDEATIELDGSLLLIAREPSIDLQVKGTGDIATLARWGIPEGEVPDGALAFDGRITGLLVDPRAQLDATSERVTMGQLVVTDLSARTLASSTGIEMESLEFGVASGRVKATASVPFAPDAERRVGASWTGVDTSFATRLLAPDLEYLPAGLSTGDLTASGIGTDVTAWQGSLRLQVAGSRNARGRLAIPGETRLTLDDAQWQVAARHALAGVAPVELDARGRLRVGQVLSEATMDAGAATLEGTDLAAVLTALRDVGLASVDPGLVASGRMEARLELGGRLVDPETSGSVLVTNIAGEGFEVASVRAEIAGRPVQPSLTYSVEAPEAVLSGQRLRDVRATGRFTDSAGPLRPSTDSGRPELVEGRGTRPTGDLGSVIVVDTLSASQADGSGRLSGSASYELASGQYSTSVEGADWQLVPTEEQPVRGFVGLRFTGTGTLEAPKGDGEIVVRDAAWRDTELGELTASVMLDGGPAARIDARAPDFGTTATAQVQIAAPYDAIVDIRTDRLDLARVLRNVETPTPVSGLATGSVHFEGTLAEWRNGAGLLEVMSLDAAVGKLPVRLAEPARLRYEAERVHVDRLEAALGETALSASGELPVFDAAPDSAIEPVVLVVMTGGVREVALAVAATGLTEVPLAGGSGPVALLARVTGSVEAPVYAADLEVGPGSITLQDLPPVTGLSLKAHAGDGWFELREGVASYQSANLSAMGKVPLSWLQPAAGVAPGGGEIHARATNLTAAVLSPFLDSTTVGQISGSIDATLDAASATPDISAITGQLQIDRLDVRVADLPITQRVPTRIVVRDGIAYVEAWDWTGQGATLGVSGQVGLSNRQVAILANGNVDLRMLTPFTRDAGMSTAGQFQSRISIIGPLDGPSIDGDATITDGGIRLADPRVLVADLNAEATLNGRSAQITSVTGTANGGALTGMGTIDYGAGGDLGALFSASVRGMALEFPDGLRSEIDGDLTMVGSIPSGGSPTGLLSGTVTVVRGSYREPLAVVAGILAGVRTQALTAGVPGGAELSPVLSALALDVRLITDEDIIVDNNYGRLDLGADLRVIGTAAAPALSGRADLREGGQLFVGRNVYTISPGSAIDFSNPVIIEPNLNILATTRVGAEDIEVRIVGPAESPTVALSSDSGLGQAEVASLLLTGRRLEDLPPGDAAFIGTQVLGNFSAEVLGFAGRAVGLDTIRLGGVDTNARRDPFAAATEVDPTTRLTFGKNIGPNANVTFSQSLRDSDAQAWIVDYALRRGLELRLVSDDEDLRSYGFRHDVSFGGANRPIQSAAMSREAIVDRVTVVNLSGDLVVPEARVRGALRLGPGDRFDFGEWQDDRERLEELYRNQGYLTPRITARRSDEAGGVALSYDVATGPQTRIAAAGIDLDSGLRSQLEDAWVESVFDDFLIAEASDIVRADLARRGYLRPAVDVRIRDEGSIKTLEITVEPGSGSARTIVRIGGATEALAREMETHLAERGLVEGVVLDSGAVEREGAAYLRANGYLRARISAGIPLFEGDTAVLPVRVDAGPVFVVSSVIFEGAQTLADEVLRDTVEVTAELPYDPGLLEGARNRLLALYRREGFAAAAVTLRPAILEDAAAVDVVFVVTEGARDRLEEVVVVGNRGIDTDVVLRAIDLSVGEPLRTEELLRARTRLFDTGLFRRIDIASERGESTSTGSGIAPVRLLVTVEEWPALRLRYGVLVAEEFRADEIDRRELVPGVSADVSRRTLFGRAITVGAVMGLQRREQRGRVFVSTPTLMSLPVESSLIAERSHEEFEGVTLVTNRSSFSWEQRARPVRTLDLSYSYTFERNRTFDTKPLDPTFALDIRINIARLNTAVAWDTRDDPSDTTRGLLASSSVEYSPEELGSDIRFVRQVTQAYYFRPWRRLVFASAARLGTVTALGGQELIPSERFLAGGARTVRSVAENSLGPRDFFGTATGGEAMVVFNQEVRVPIYRWVRGVAFLDAGNVFAERGDAKLGDLVGALGVGLRVSTPFALLRVDFAKTAWGAPTSSGLWTFGIGHAF